MAAHRRTKRTARIVSARFAFAALVNRPAVYRPLRSPCGAPLPLPPCIRHRALPLIAGDRQEPPERVRAAHRGAAKRRVGSRLGCMGLMNRSVNLLSRAKGY